MKIPLNKVQQLLRHCPAMGINDENGERPLIRPNTEFYREDERFLTLDWTNDEGLDFHLTFEKAKNAEVEYSEDFGGLVLIDSNGDAIELRLLEPMRERFDTSILYDLPLDRKIHDDKIERFIPYDRLGYEYQQWLHKNRKALIKTCQRFEIPLAQEEKDDKVNIKGKILVENDENVPVRA